MAVSGPASISTRSVVVEGASTAELDAFAHAYTAGILGATSAPLGYGGMFALPTAYCDLAHAGLYAVGLGGVPVCGFPGATCISVNEVVCHGVPGPRRLARGDIVNIDVTVIADGFHGDTSRMWIVGGAAVAAPAAVALVRRAGLGRASSRGAHGEPEFHRVDPESGSTLRLL